MAKEKKTRIFKCGKCNQGEIVTVHEFNVEISIVNIKKCSNQKCKYQYYFKELLNAKLDIITKPIINF